LVAEVERKLGKLASMNSLRVVNSAGNAQNYQVDAIPHIGELVVLFKGGGETAIQAQYFRVQDVLHSLQGEAGHQVSILLGEETKMNWA
jgi:hypothetical protein